MNNYGSYHFDFIFELYIINCVLCCFFTKQRYEKDTPLEAHSWIYDYIQAIHVLDLFENVAPHQIVISEVINVIINVMIELARIPCCLRIQKTWDFFTVIILQKYFPLL